MLKWWRWLMRTQLYTKIGIGAVIGIILGFVLGEQAAFIAPVGDLFLRLLQMLIVPLVFFSIISGIMKVGDAKALGTTGLSFIIYLIMSSLIATIVGVIIALIVQPGHGAQGLLTDGGEEVQPEDYNFVDQIISWVPTNIVESMAEMEMIQIIVFAILIGTAMLLLGDRVSGVTKATNQGFEIMLKLTRMVIQVAPIGILALLADLVGTIGEDMLWEAARFLVADYLALLIILVIVYPLILLMTTRLNPIQFYKNVFPSMLFAASTVTSNATIPVSMQVAKENLGVRERIYSFTVPFGATVNMDGFSVALGAIAVFAANVYDIPITFGLIFQFVFLGLILSIGAAGVAGAGIVMSTVLLDTLGLPLDLIPILAAIWPLIDIGHTTTNITGDLTGTTVISKYQKDIDKRVFNRKNKQLEEETEREEE